MRALVLTVVALAALTAGALAAERALRASPGQGPGLTLDSARPLFALDGLRHGDRAQRCAVVTNAGDGEVRASVLGRAEDGDLAPLLRAVVTRGCAGGTVLFSGTLDALARATDPEPWAAGEQRRYGIAIEVEGTDEQVQGRRAVHEFAFAAEVATRDVPSGAGDSAGAGDPAPPACARLLLSRDRRRIIKHYRVDARVTARLILRVYGLAGRQRLVLVTGLRVGRRVLWNRRYGSVAYRINRGATVTSRRRPFRVRIAAGALKPGRNVVHVNVRPRGAKALRARYILTIRGGRDGCEIG